MSAEFPNGYTFTYLGSTTTHDVYDVVFYPEIVNNAPGQEVYRAAFKEYAAKAKAANRTLWLAVDIGRVPSGAILPLFYAIAAPFLRLRVTIRTYNISDAELRRLEPYKLILRLAQSALGHRFVTDLASALPAELKERGT